MWQSFKERFKRFMSSDTYITKNGNTKVRIKKSVSAGGNAK